MGGGGGQCSLGEALETFVTKLVASGTYLQERGDWAGVRLHSGTRRRLRVLDAIRTRAERMPTRSDQRVPRGFLTRLERIGGKTDRR